jgi:hypothetical protein
MCRTEQPETLNYVSDWLIREMVKVGKFFFMVMTIHWHTPTLAEARNYASSSVMMPPASTSSP